jgi:membrane-bound lytic murein transglycosylase D
MTTKFVRLVLTILAIAALAACNSQPKAGKAAAGMLSVPAQPSPSAPPHGAGGYRGPVLETSRDPSMEEDEDDDDEEFSYQGPSLRSGYFPKPPELQPQIAFWRKVYAEWGRSQVAIHDDRYMNVIYEVIELPGDVRDGYTLAQKELVSDRLDYWKLRLSILERKLADRDSLDGDDQRLVSRFGSAGQASEAFSGAADRVRAQRGLRERFKRGLEISGRYDRHFKAIFRKAGLPEELAYLPHVESSFQANARSSAGAVGIWQFTPGAARTFMDSSRGYDARLDPIASARGAARYLSHAYDTLGSWPLALTSYNHGIGGMKRAKGQYGHDFARIVQDYDHPQFGFASRNYYAEFLAACEIVTQPDRYFPEGVAYEGTGISQQPAVAAVVEEETVSEAAEVSEPEIVQAEPRPRRVLPAYKPRPVLAAHSRAAPSRAALSARATKTVQAISRSSAPSRYAGFKTVSYSRADGTRRTGYARIAAAPAKTSATAVGKANPVRMPANGKGAKVQLASRR